MATEPVVSRLTKLNQLIQNKTKDNGLQSLLAKEGLLDALLVLYDECNQENLTRDKHISLFVQKHKATIRELRRLRLSISDFEIKDVIGRGHFGEVKVVREKSNGDVYAMKVLRKSDTLAKENVAFFEEERDIMARADNTWITSLQYAFQDEVNLYLVMEFLPGGDLLSLLSRYDDILEENMARFYLAELVAALHSLHMLGYVHRDIKPDNILIDRTGHIKLADFGSAAKLSSAKTVNSKMPVGTPDYVSPEVLVSMNKTEGGNYGVECDWWSVGIVAYEMLYGKTPFAGDTVMETYSNIMNHAKTLRFPIRSIVTKNAIDLIKGLCCKREKRLGYEGLGCHVFFSGVNWATLRKSVPPFVPTVNSVDDTSNFDEFDAAPPTIDVNSFMKKKDFSGRNLPFVGFTFTKQLSNITKPLLALDVASPAAKTSTERQLAAKTKELNELKEKYHQMELEHAPMSRQFNDLNTTISDKTDNLKRLQKEKDLLEKEKAMSLTEIANLKRILETERKEHELLDGKAVQLVAQISEMNKKAESIRNDTTGSELNEYKLAFTQLELDRYVASQRAENLETEMKTRQKELEESKSLVIDLQGKLAKSKESSRGEVQKLQRKLEKISEESKQQITDLKDKLSKANDANAETTNLLQNLRNSKDQMEKQMNSKIAKSDCCQMVQQRLQERKDIQKSLENRLHVVQEREVMLKESVESKHSVIQNLTSKLLEIEDKYEETLQKLQKSERDNARKETATEGRVTELKLKLESARTEQTALQDVINKNQQRLEEYVSDIAMKEKEVQLERNKVKMLEQQISETLTTRSERFANEIKETRRVEAEKLADLRQEKLYLETQVGMLEATLKTKDAEGSMQAKQVTELQEKFKKKTCEYQAEVQSLKEQLRESQNTSMEATSTITHLQDSEGRLKERLQRLHQQLDDSVKEAQEKISSVENERDEIEEQFNRLRDSCSVITDMEENIQNVTEQCAELSAQNEVLKMQVDEVTESKNSLVQEMESVNNELFEKKQQCANQELTISMLKTSCTMLEEQVTDLEKLNEKLENKEENLRGEKSNLDSSIQQMRTKLQEMTQTLEEERNVRCTLESECKILEENMEQVKLASKAQEEIHQQQINRYKETKDTLTKDLHDLEKKTALTEVNLTSAERMYLEEQRKCSELQDEIDEMVKQLTAIKNTNFKLTQSLEAAIDTGEQIKNEKMDIENEYESTQYQYNHEKIKLKETLSQQTKLIDFLQTKVQNPTKKKRKLFGKQKDHDKQYKDLQRALEAQKTSTTGQGKTGRQHVRTRQNSASHPKENKSENIGCFATTPKTQSILSKAIVLSPSSQPSPAALQTPARQQKQKAGQSSKQPKERMKHNIPHRFVIGLNTRATKCAVCLDTVFFGRQASKCEECQLVCHSRCVPSLPHTCGLPTQYLKHFGDAMSTKSATPMINASKSDGSVHLQAWMKIPRAGKQGWDKRWVCLQENKLRIYSKETSAISEKAMQEHDLCPTDGEVTVLPGVSASDLPNTAATDLPYVMRIDWRPHTSCWPGKSIYLMTMGFEDKQQWMAVLEKLVDQRKNSKQEREYAKLIGNTMLSLEGENSVDFNSTLLLQNKFLLLGSEDGLFSLSLSNQTESLSQIVGVNSIYQMEQIQELGIALFICGKERNLCIAELANLMRAAEEASVSETTVPLKQISGIISCHIFSLGMLANGVYICAATPQKIIILKYNKGTSKFCIRKEIKTAEPCSCVMFTKRSILVGTDRFYQIELNEYRVDEFLDSTDTSLAYAIYGASHDSSFPIAAVKVSPEDSKVEEFLLCFHEFGMYVNDKGRRSRPDDMKWSRLPLSFTYNEPYLFVTHFNSVEVVEIKSHDQTSSPGEPTFLMLPTPRYVGPAMSKGAIYLATTKDQRIELVCLQGNLQNARERREQDSKFVTPVSKTKRKSLATKGSMKRILSEDTINQPPSKQNRTSGSSLASLLGLRRSPRFSPTTSLASDMSDP
ncbi:citron Rho-interacting kinase-like [Anneissia japonica]|uniref:citron Rho-interacting kinase-like n=1 Tax=Anneissia japonica TaxID=1529436 RepID=UPI0014257A9C|nr:citron Rho-interacting kinase-like [Anneissia japonica]